MRHYEPAVYRASSRDGRIALRSWHNPVVPSTAQNKTAIKMIKASTRVNEIDLLRFLAALAVVFYHYAFRGYAADNMTVMPYPLLAPAAKYGYLGVDLF